MFGMDNNILALLQCFLKMDFRRNWWDIGYFIIFKQFTAVLKGYNEMKNYTTWEKQIYSFLNTLFYSFYTS